MLWPPFVSIYKHGVLLNERWKLFSHSSHRVLSLATHRFSMIAGVVLICGSIVTANIVDATQPTRGAGQFAQGAMIDRIISRDTDVVVTAAQIGTSEPQWWQTDVALQNPLPTDVIVVEEETSIIENAVTGIALVPPSKIGKTERTRTEIEEYIVEGGDTAGTIAAKFDLRIQTLLDANNLDDPDLIAPGDTLKILPIDGVRHKWKKKDTLKSIAKLYNAEIESILDFNKFDAAPDIEVGSIIIVPDGRIPEPEPEPEEKPEPVREVTPTISDVATVTPAPQPVSPPAPEPVEEAEPEYVETVLEEPAVDEVAAVNEVVNTNIASNATGSLIWPTTTSRISQQYGYGHTGLDIDGEFGDPTYAADNGTVVSSGYAGSYGNMVVIDHGNGVVTRYAHLQTLAVSAGQSVTQGMNIGEQGSTGNSTGSHLHYEVMVDGQFVNPYSR